MHSGYMLAEVHDTEASVIWRDLSDYLRGLARLCEYCMYQFSLGGVFCTAGGSWIGGTDRRQVLRP